MSTEASILRNAFSIFGYSRPVARFADKRAANLFSFSQSLDPLRADGLCPQGSVIPLQSENPR